MHYEVKEQDIVDFASSQGLRVKKVGDECAFLYCPYCKGGSSKDKWTFYVNARTGQYECKRSSCGVRGNMITLARDFDFQLSDEFSNFYRKRPSYRTLPQPKAEIIPKPAAVSYLESRCISSETAKAYRVTVQTENESVMCFPVYDENGKMVNVKYRNLNYTKDKKNGISMYELLNGADGNVVREINMAKAKGCKDPGGLFMRMWIFIHGAACMTLSGDYDLTDAETEQLLVKAYESFEKV